jgi:excisionase family DNA binding protein
MPKIEVSHDKLLTPEEFSIRVGLGRESVRRLTREGVISVIRLSHNLLRYRESEVEKFLSGKA